MGIKASKPASAPGEEPLALAAAPSDATKAVRSRTNKKRSRSNLTVSTTSSKRTKHDVGSSDTSNSWSHSLAMETDKDNLTQYACFVREQIELFCVTQKEVDRIRETAGKLYSNKRGEIVAGQVGLRCKHCQQVLSFPGTLNGVNASARNSVLKHFMNECNESKEEIRNKLIELKTSHGGRRSGWKSRGNGQYTAPDYMEKCLRDVGIREQFGQKQGLFLRPRTGLT